MRVRTRRFDKGWKSGAVVPSAEAASMLGSSRAAVLRNSGKQPKAWFLAQRRRGTSRSGQWTCGLLDRARRRGRRGAPLASSRAMAPPCSSSFGPSRPHWVCGIGTTTSADFCLAHHGLHRGDPGFRASPTPWSGADLPG